MRFGCCTGIDGIQSVEGAGYDYVELPVGTVLPEADESEWAPARRQILAHKIKAEVWNCLLPAELRLTGPEVDRRRAEKYVATAFRRIAEVGGRVVVFGSGGARRAPEGFQVDEARRQLTDFIRTVGDSAHENALRLAIEPLNRRECNVINSVPEALSYAEAVNHPAVGVLADFFHMDEEHEPFTGIVEARHYLIHTHTADTGRRHPGTGSYDHDGFFAALRAAGFDARISAECSWGDNVDADRKAALEFLKWKWSQSEKS